MTKIFIIVNVNSGYYNRSIIYNFKIILKDYFYIIKHTYNIEQYNHQLTKLKRFDTLIVVGGDGTVFHAVQYIINNNIDIYIGHIPTGSGNGLSKSLLYYKNLDYNLNNSINNVLKLERKKLDIMQVELLNENIYIYSFLFISCGIFSNIDVGSDFMRFIGNYRFTISAILQIIFKNTFYGILEYETIDKNFIKKIHTIEGTFVFFMANNLSHCSENTHTSPGSLPTDGLIKINYLLEPCSRFELTKILLELESGNFINRIKTINTNNFKLTPFDGYLDIDGEFFESQPIKVNLHKEKLKIHY